VLKVIGGITYSIIKEEWRQANKAVVLD